MPEKMFVESKVLDRIFNLLEVFPVVGYMLAALFSDVSIAYSTLSEGCPVWFRHICCCCISGTFVLLRQ
ncbi:hypothetical protein BDV95DRAFT_278688 [Massariosphaeria phaeospora]|uniref:Uncharacterized protein n=1 Tax=Massariosphaeria phaeospora TaxID=100035 RepID=A0A7C8MUX5_9PLEO|nr:hypothetical protein BDV95DRAFT_278688 [Massariosphaeria phaeospora]